MSYSSSSKVNEPLAKHCPCFVLVTLVCAGVLVQVGVPGGAARGIMGKWPSPDCVCNEYWQQTYTRTGVLEFSRDR